jgi:hypothetical protein
VSAFVAVDLARPQGCMASLPSTWRGERPRALPSSSSVQ